MVVMRDAEDRQSPYPQNVYNPIKERRKTTSFPSTHSASPYPLCREHLFVLLWSLPVQGSSGIDTATCPWGVL